MRIWLYKPIYESLPYMYLVAGGGIGMASLASLYFNYQYWLVYFVVGLSLLSYGLLNLKRRKDFRNADRKASLSVH